MSEYRNILVVQTAFPGDVILTLPLVQILKCTYRSSNIDVVVTPRAAGLLNGHPDIHRIVVYDKRGGDAGIVGMMRMVSMLRKYRYDLALVPHRSLRSALLVTASSIGRRIAFDSSAARFLFTDIVHYEKSSHETDRNLQLLRPLGISHLSKEFPHLYPSLEDRRTVEEYLHAHGVADTARLIGIAPGTVWNTKRWLKEGFIALLEKLAADGFQVILIGGTEDAELCREILSSAGTSRAVSSAGEFSLLQSAEAVRRCRVIVSNDSAPMHLALAMGTPVIAIFGATIPEFGFAPYGPHDVVVETHGLPCRPCSIHGGDKCPITTFDCMKRISAEDVYARVNEVLKKHG